MIIPAITKLQNKLKKIDFECSNPKVEFEKIIQPRRYKIPIFGNLGENNCLYVDFMFVSNYNKDPKFNKKTQWNKREPIKAYAKLIAKNDNSKVFFDILENLKFEDNSKANKILMDFCVDQLKDEIKEVKENSKNLYKMIRKSNKFHQKNIINLTLIFALAMLVLTVFIGVVKK